ncbi:hypothetical protein CL615_02045 [archaeon]|jgi:hypothetical protein|nr:hypothetical protein [archaeon]MDP6547527.1 hypothetical protein [Candidatus Woesearchaeota archaeon]|tara:strand:+ start:17297 stop:18430 length:1134 start_codon:yes stop_codon:yes gene_type:complete
MKKNKLKAQIWFTDFVIGTLIFSFMLIAYYTYTTNISKQNSFIMDDLISDGKSISSSVLLSGFPDNWNNATVQSIGITNNNQKINNTKIVDFNRISYDTTKKLFGTAHDYLIFFTDENGTVLNVEGVCGIGKPEINLTFNTRSAYYNSDDTDSFLKDFMIETLVADIYNEDDPINDFDAFIVNINDYGFVAIEHPDLSTAIFDNNKKAIEDYTSNRGFLMMSGQITSGQEKEMAGVKYYKKSGQSISNRNSTIVSEDEFLSFTVGKNIIFSQAYYVENQSESQNFTEIVKFNDDNKIAVSRWSYGNGSVFYFSDFDVSFFSGNFVEEITEAIKKWGNFKCNPIDLGNTQYKNFIKLERFLIYNSKPIKMVFYLWSNI